MENILEVINNIQATFGAAIVVPIMIFIVALIMKVKVNKAMMSAFYAGIGLTGFGWVIGSFLPTATSVISKLVDSTGINLPIFDNGWQAGSVAAFGSTVGLAFFVIALILQVVLFTFKITKIFAPANLWNNFGFMIWGSVAYVATGSWWLSIALMTFMLLYSLVISEMLADSWSAYYGVPNATINSLHNTEMFIPAIILDPIWNLLGVNKVKMTPEAFKKKLGVFGEPATLGALLGFIIGFLANIKELNQLSAWGSILNFSISLAAVMTIFPLITGVFAKAFIPLAEAMKIEESDELDETESRFSPKRWFIGVDDGVGFGEPATIIAGTILIPIMVIIAFILPGNRTMPVVDLIALPFMIQPFIALSRGNMLKAILNGMVWFSLGLYIASPIAEWYTQAVAQYGPALPTGVVLITSFNLIARPLNGLIFLAFVSQNPLFIGAVVIIYLASLVLLRTKRASIWKYLIAMADKNTGYVNESHDKIFLNSESEE